MKRILKSRIFIFVLGLVIAGSVGVYAVSVASSDVTYDNTNSGSEATTVSGAIDDLYAKVGSGGSASGTLVVVGTANARFGYTNQGGCVGRICGGGTASVTWTLTVYVTDGAVSNYTISPTSSALGSGSGSDTSGGQASVSISSVTWTPAS